MHRACAPLTLVAALMASACAPADQTSDETRAALERGRELAQLARDSADSVARWEATLRPRPGDPIDSALTIEEQLRRFREGMGDPLTRMLGGAPSRDSLVRAFVARLAVADTAELVALAMNAREFADLYYPGSRYTRPPYEMAPSLVWMQFQLNSEKGLVRLLRRVAGQPIAYDGHACPGEAVTVGSGRVWESCTVSVTLGDGSAITARWFGGIFERDGRFKFIGFANEM
jgi:hypothetical protein